MLKSKNATNNKKKFFYSLGDPKNFDSNLIEEEIKSSQKHYDLESFKKFAKENYEEDGKYVIGTEFEYEAIKELEALQFELKRVGGSNDQGKDLEGFWKLPNQLHFNVICQCKKISKKVSSAIVRELEGTLSNERNQKIGILISGGTGFSPEAIQAFHKTEYPLIFINIDQDGISYFKLNASCQKLIPALVVGSSMKKSTSNHKRVVVLLFDNKPIS